jgi:hypothetical protein
MSCKDKERPPKPDVDWIQITAWKALVDINDAITVFRGIHNDMLKTPCWVKTLICLSQTKLWKIKKITNVM